MLHEMAHLHNLTHDIQDVSNNGYYHNTKFKTTAEAHGLHIEKDKRYGWSVTTLTDDTAAWLAGQPGMEYITASRQTSKNRSIKYVCPCCGTIIRATREVNVVCGDCGEPFEQA